MTDQPTALVTGANRGLGQSIALALGRSGHRVIAAHRPGSDATETVRLLQAERVSALPWAIDVTDAAGHRDAVSSLLAMLHAEWAIDRLDVLVNNAGIGAFAPIDDVTPDSFDALLATNLRGTFFLTQAMLPLLEGGGHVINISTSLTRHVSPATAVYAASKAAVETLSRSLAVELGPRGIRVNSVAPGPTATDFNGGAMRDDTALRAELAAHTALGRVGDASEIGDAVASLASPAMRWVTGERLEVSGGSYL
ncbi:NAD(P)-dependent dehydrogenase (short-subunit alcohol dehydrogenase family) [Microbacterium terrae]|uniref:3-oxoacyl-[acyl-carrier-protein] reductase FabG n=1 Tax=Microbacterium terrae TaxID=69369 RepID=A0A0M2HBB7_9MICO|nr:SDR family oxidoreductase [Microbacterium terrae]KJL43903.1 3-oxoacyl-[acyl-carrier-protein] reductase FabG [Microbacterium terrae]MBP1078688.1 NAD(P)-dependent dehydrogenase (short-subunit alcohol dehydrogenase family) [Microbacterium terrae]GLJ98089.1 3-oxoacyl-ACP reductase [Microbacterium terrae]